MYYYSVNILSKLLGIFTCYYKCYKPLIFDCPQVISRYVTILSISPVEYNENIEYSDSLFDFDKNRIRIIVDDKIKIKNGNPEILSEVLYDLDSAIYQYFPDDIGYALCNWSSQPGGCGYSFREYLDIKYYNKHIDNSSEYKYLISKNTIYITYCPQEDNYRYYSITIERYPPKFFKKYYDIEIDFI